MSDDPNIDPRDLDRFVNLDDETGWDEIELRQAIAIARLKASPAGPLHALWDTIADAEALLAGKPTLLDYGSRENAFKELIAKLS